MKKKRVLFVDDEEAVSMLCGWLLERTGRFAVRAESRGTEALATARQFRPDLIFLDCHLPDKSGAEIARDLRADSELKSIPMVFITGGLTRGEAALRTEELGEETIAKPMLGDELVRRAFELTDDSGQDGDRAA